MVDHALPAAFVQEKKASSSARLTYWNGRGRAETIRMMLWVVGIDFDERHLLDAADLNELRTQRHLLFDQVPLLEIDGMRLVQSRAIVRYLAAKGGLRGSGISGETLCDIVAETVWDWKGSIGLAFEFSANGFEPNAEQCARIMAGNAKFLPRFERLLSELGTGLLVGANLTYADVLMLEPLEQLADQGLLVEALRPYPCLQSFHARLLSEPRLFEWRSMRKTPTQADVVTYKAAVNRTLARGAYALATVVKGPAPPTGGMQLPVWLDVDTGIDDAQALLLAIRSPRLRVVGVSTVSGNTDVELVTAATLRVLDAAGAPLGLPVARGAALPLVESVHPCPQIHGQDSLGDLQPPIPASKRAVGPESAVTALLSKLEAGARSGEPKLTLVALGPLTNVALALRERPDICRARLERIVWMGGANTYGNYTAAAEANAAYDPEAAHIVMSSGIPLMLYTWDVYQQVSFSRAELAAMGYVEGSAPVAPTPWASLSTRLMWREMRHWNAEIAMIGDAGAVAGLLVPGALRTRRLHVAVETRGEFTRGMTICDMRPEVSAPDVMPLPPNAEVCVGVDAAALKSAFAEAVLHHRESSTP